MKTLLLIFISLYSFAVEVSFVGPCSSEPIIKTQFNLEENKSAGFYSFKALEDSGLVFDAAEGYVKSVDNSPVGLEAMEVISDTFMRSHGWCYLVDGKMFGAYPDKVEITQNSSIEWFYCFATYDTGVWLDEYLPTYTVKPKEFCN